LTIFKNFLLQNSFKFKTASSYNCYKNFDEKGKHYKKLVREYGKED
jgi:hypothetical protein